MFSKNEFLIIYLGDYATIQTDAKTPGELLDDFCSKLHDVNSTIPDPVILHYMKKAGFLVNDTKLVKIVSLASQKFIAEIINDCMQFHKIKTSSKTTLQLLAPQKSSGSNDSNKQQTNTAVLTIEDLSTVLQDYGINVKKPYYFM